ncbi:MAG: Lipopolysaccharide biosynthesis protein [Pedosphaera sp.]|nr:Lipopolysaccharide biosynthesis protein [Pedosphaera sp.]
MSNKRQGQQAGGINLGDIYFVLFRQKWKILLFSCLGFVAAGVLFVIKPAQFQSEAKLNIRFIEEKRFPTASTGGDSPNVTTVAIGSANLISTEIEFLTSPDTAMEVVKAVGAEKILAKAGGGSDPNAAVGLILKNLTTDPITRGSVLHIIFQHPDYDLSQSLLAELIGAYYKTHDEQHGKFFGQKITEETARLRKDIEDTTKQLREAKNQAGVTSLEDARKASTDQMSKIREQLIAVGGELAARRGAMKAGGTLTPIAPQTTNSLSDVPEDKIKYYNTACLRLAQDRETERDYLFKKQYKEESLYVVEIREKIAEDEKLKKKLETEFPKLATLALPAAISPGARSGLTRDLADEAATVRGLEDQTAYLTAQLEQVRLDAAKVDDMESTIMELQRRKDQLESSLRYLQGNMEQKRLAAQMGDRHGSDIEIVTSPTPPERKRSKSFKKLLGMALAGGVFGGIAVAFLFELVLDRSVKRSVEVERKLGLPLFISIPDITKNGARRRAKAAAQESRLLRDAEQTGVVVAGDEPVSAEMAPWNPRNGLHPFYEGLRDRLIVNFEVRNLTHNPKLVAVTSCHKGAGVSSIAAGLAASLSETGDGNVLLVDMNGVQGAAQHFYKGQPGCGLDDALETETMNNALVQGNLYVASERLENGKLPRVLPKRFASLMPKLKASDYDYIIFDMPPVTQTSMTPRLAGLMDMVLLVIESEKTNLDVVKRANSLLAESKANVSTVLNKTQNYVPKMLHQELLNDI